MRNMLRLTLSVGVLVGWLGVVFAQSYEPYSPLDPEWRQGRHDYKKTARAPLRCDAPPSTYSFTERQDPNDSYIYLTTGDRDGDGVTEIFYVGDDRGAWDGSPNVWMASSGAVLCDNAFWADQAAGECVITTSGEVYCPLTETDTWGGVDGYFTKGTNSCGEVYRRSEGETHSNLTIDDVDNDGTPEIFRGLGSWAISVRAANSYLENWSVNLGSNVGTPVVGDFDGNGSKDVCFPLANGQIRCFNAATGASLWTTSTPCGWGPTLTSGEYGPPSYWTQALMADDINRDGRDELVILGNSCTAVYQHNGTSFVSMWNAAYGSDRAGAIGDVTGDGYYDVVIGNGGTFYVLDGLTGSLVASFTPTDGSINQNCSAPTIADINGDMVWEVLTACTRPVAYSRVNSWASAVWQAPNTSPYSITSDLVVSKVTNSTLMVVYGDASCYVDIWTCPVATIGTGEQELGTEEKPTEAVRFSVRAVDGGIIVEGYRGEVSVYTASGSLVKRVNVENRAKIDLKAGIYLIKAGSNTVSVIVR